MASTIRGNDNFDSASISGQRGELVYEGSAVHTAATETTFQFGVTGSDYAWYEILLANKTNVSTYFYWRPAVGSTLYNVTAFQGAASSGRMLLLTDGFAWGLARIFLWNNPDSASEVSYYVKGFGTGFSASTHTAGTGGGTTSNIRADGIAIYSNGAAKPDLKVFGIKA